jgi:uncharacterized membrane protein
MIGAMAFNPYEPPRTDEVWQPPPPTGVMAGYPLPWSIEDALAVGWDRVKRWWPVLVLGWVGVSIATSVLTEMLEAIGFPRLAELVSLVLSSFLSIGLTRASLAAVRGQAPSFEQLIGGGDRLLAMIAATVLAMLAVAAGLVVFVIPGLVIALGLAFIYFTCVDEQLGPIAALERSWKLTDGCKLQLLGFGLVSLIVLVAGVLALVLGVFVAMPVIYVATAWIYTRRRGELVPERLG